MFFLRKTTVGTPPAVLNRDFFFQVRVYNSFLCGTLKQLKGLTIHSAY